MTYPAFDYDQQDIAWCPGCGNFGIVKALKETLNDLRLREEEVVLVSGIGQAAKTPQYVRSHMFNGLHGRALPPATAIKAANPHLTVIVTSGDGDMYGEGGNHFMHAVRRNPDITVIVHNNMVYGLTKGQASPTSGRGFKTPVQIDGATSEPFNPLAVAIALDAGFVARVFMGYAEQMKAVMKQAISHKGFALVDIFQPCVTFNRVNTYQWFREHTYVLDETHNPENRLQAFARACETEKLPLGVFYVNPHKPTFEQALAPYADCSVPLFARQPARERVRELLRQACD